MNGIIHPCSNPQEGPKPRNETEMFNNIFAYTDRVIAITRPQKVIYVAIDGVAPRAKMN
jgi:5'-3' exoribonuclease 2